MVCIYDGKVPNHPIVDGARPPPPRRDSITARLTARVAMLEALVEEQDRQIAQLKSRSQVREEIARERRDRRALREKESSPQREMLGAMMAVVARHAGIDVADFRNSRRGRRESWPRQMLCYLARTHCWRLSLPRIAAAIDKDHTTILHAVRVVDRRLKERHAATVALYEACLPDVEELVRAMKARIAASVGDGSFETGACRGQG